MKIASIIICLSFCQSIHARQEVQIINTDSVTSEVLYGPMQINDTLVALRTASSGYTWLFNTRTLSYSQRDTPLIPDPEHIQYGWEASMMPDGRFIYYVGKGKLNAYSADKGIQTLIPEDHTVFDRYITDIKEHVSGMVCGVGLSASAVAYWPSEKLWVNRIAWSEMHTCRFFRDGAFVVVYADGTEDVLTESHDMGRHFKILYRQEQRFSSISGNTPGEWGRYVGFTCQNFLKFVDRLTGQDYNNSGFGSSIFVSTPDTLYTPSGCSLFKSVLDTAINQRYVDDSLCIADIYQLEGIQLTDGRLFTTGRGYVHYLSNAPVRPYLVRDIRVTCDTLRVRIYGEKRYETDVRLSSNVLVEPVKRTEEPTSLYYTFVRRPNNGGKVQLIVSYKNLRDTIRLTDMKSWQASQLHLVDTIAAFQRVLQVREDSMVALIQWYRNGKQIKGEQHPVDHVTEVCPVTEPGVYYAHVLTSNWCETVTDSIEIKGTSVEDDMNIADISNASSMIVYDLLGQEILRREINSPNEINNLSSPMPIGFAVFYDSRYNVVGRYRIVGGRMR